MPHKYEREIEEILRNMEQAEPRRGIGDRIRAFPRPTPTPRPRPPVTLTRFTGAEWLLALGVVFALVGAGMAYYLGGQTLVTGAIAVAGFALLLIALVTGWMAHFQGPRAPRAWRGAATTPTPIGLQRRGFFSAIAVQFRILRLKWRYWRSHER